MNLIEDPWIPVRLADGGRRLIRPAEIAVTENPPRAIDSPRADFDGALAQFLIGLLQTAFAPHDDETWDERLEHPPSVDELARAFSPYVFAFDLDGEGPRFMQDLEPPEKAEKGRRKREMNEIGALLIEAPGDQTLRKNTDHFVKRGHVKALCPVCVATALFTLQINAPSGGQGHRTGLRGGGPMTTLVVLDPNGSGLPDTLWHNLWLNVLPRSARLTGNDALDGREHIFPWLAATRTSNPKKGGQDTTPEDAHPLQMYWAMPRRIRLDFDDRREGFCDICGTEASLIRRYFTVNYGINYTGAWRHPLTPYRGSDKELVARHPQPGGIGYRHWLGLVHARADDKQRLLPAQVVEAFLRETTGMGQVRLWAFGYDMDNMKPRCWYESTVPLYRVPPQHLEPFERVIRQMIDAADLVAGLLRDAVKEAWFRRPGDARGDTAFLADGFWRQTEPDFYASFRLLLGAIPQGKNLSILGAWHRTLRDAAIRLFDECAASGEVAFADPGRVARAHDKLVRQLNGKELKNLLSLSTIQEKSA